MNQDQKNQHKSLKKQLLVRLFSNILTMKGVKYYVFTQDILTDSELRIFLSTEKLLFSVVFILENETTPMGMKSLTRE